jgi:DNA polymerase III sliding clamp (beta) subunit (PCNA family)
MTTQIKTLRENIIKAISGIKDDNVSIAGVAIDRRKLLDALKLQTSDTVTIQYGKISWLAGNFGDGNYNKTKWYDHSIEPESALQITCDRTVMRFLNRPHVKRGRSISDDAIPLAFIDHKTESIKPVTGIPLDTRELLEALTYVFPCVAVEESRFVLRCVCFSVTNEVLTLAAADGFRLGIAKLAVKSIPDMRIIVHANDVNRLITFLKSIKPVGRGKSKYYPEVYFSANDKEISLATRESVDGQNRPIIGKQVDAPTQVGTFPDYDKLIPSEGTKVEFIASDLYEAIQAVAPYSRDGSGIVRLQATINDVIKVSARSEELGESTSEVAAKVQADCRIAANCNYLLDVLRLCGDNKVTLKITTPSSPMVFETSPEKLTVVMPMFVQWQEADPPRVANIAKAQEVIDSMSEYPTVDNSDELVEARNI